MHFNNWVEFREAKLFLLTISAIRFYATGPEGLPAVIRQIFVGVQRKFRASYISTSFSSPFTAHLHNCWINSNSAQLKEKKRASSLKSSKIYFKSSLNATRLVKFLENKLFSGASIEPRVKRQTLKLVIRKI